MNVIELVLSNGFSTDREMLGSPTVSAAPHRGRGMDAARPTPRSRADIEALRRQAAEDEARDARR